MAIAATALRAIDKTDIQTNRAPNLSKARADATHPNTIQSIDFLSFRCKKAPWISPRGEVEIFLGRVIGSSPIRKIGT
jgi:hypothetical protein